MNIRLEGSRAELDFFVSVLRSFELDFEFNGKYYANRGFPGYRIYLRDLNIEQLNEIKISADKLKRSRQNKNMISLNRILGNEKSPKNTDAVLGGKTKD